MTDYYVTCHDHAPDGSEVTLVRDLEEEPTSCLDGNCSSTDITVQVGGGA